MRYLSASSHSKDTWWDSVLSICLTNKDTWIFWRGCVTYKPYWLNVFWTVKLINVMVLQVQVPLQIFIKNINMNLFLFPPMLVLDILTTCTQYFSKRVSFLFFFFLNFHSNKCFITKHTWKHISHGCMALFTGLACAHCKLYKLSPSVTANTMSKSVKHEFPLQNLPEYCYFVSKIVQAAVIVSIPPKKLCISKYKHITSIPST